MDDTQFPKVLGRLLWSFCLTTLIGMFAFGQGTAFFFINAMNWLAYWVLVMGSNGYGVMHEVLPVIDANAPGISHSNRTRHYFQIFSWYFPRAIIGYWAIQLVTMVLMGLASISDESNSGSIEIANELAQAIFAMSFVLGTQIGFWFVGNFSYRHWKLSHYHLSWYCRRLEIPPDGMERIFGEAERKGWLSLQN